MLTISKTSPGWLIHSASVALPMALYKYVYDYDMIWTTMQLKQLKFVISLLSANTFSRMFSARAFKSITKEPIGPFLYNPSPLLVFKLATSVCHIDAAYMAGVKSAVVWLCVSLRPCSSVRYPAMGEDALLLVGPCCVRVELGDGARQVQEQGIILILLHIVSALVAAYFLVNWVVLVWYTADGWVTTTDADAAAAADADAADAAAAAAAAAADDDDVVVVDAIKAQSCDLHHCQLLIGRIRQLTTTDSTTDITDTDPACTCRRRVYK